MAFCLLNYHVHTMGIQSIDPKVALDYNMYDMIHIPLYLNWDVDGAIIFYNFDCRGVAIYPMMVKKALQDELGIPVLILEGDIYDSRNYTAEQLRTMVETFAEMLKARKG